MYRFFLFIFAFSGISALGIYWYVPYKIKQLTVFRIKSIAARRGIEIENIEVKADWHSVTITDLSASGKKWRAGFDKIKVTSWKVHHLLPPEVSLGDINVTGVRFKGRIPEFLKKRGSGYTSGIPPGSSISWSTVNVDDIAVSLETSMGKIESEGGNAIFTKDNGGQIELWNTRLAVKKIPFYHVDSITLDISPGRKIERIGLKKLIWKVNDELKLNTETLSIIPSGKKEWKVAIKGKFLNNKGSLTLKGIIKPHEETGNFEVVFSRLKPSSILKAKLPLIHKEQIVSDGQLKLDISKKAIHAVFNGEMKNISLKHAKLADKPLENIDISGFYDVLYNRKTSEIIIKKARIKHNKLLAEITGTIRNIKSEPLIDVNFTVPKTGCQNVVDSVPEALIPHIKRFKFKGYFRTDLNIFVDMADIKNKNSVKLSGKVDPSGCRVVKIPVQFRPSRFRNNFGYSIKEPGGQRLNIEVDEDSDWYAPLDEISPYMIKAVLTTEDGRFYRHHGFITREFTTALRRNLMAGRFKFGASSITMQVVKNIMLERKKTLSRKLEELVLTWFIEKHLSKKRLMEIYLNIIELGPGIYGVKHASQMFFGKPPEELTPKEAIYLASLLPSPKKRFKYYCRGKVSPGWNRYLNYLLKVMRRRHKITEEEYLAAKEEEIVFDHTDFIGEHACFRLIRRYSKHR